MVLTCYGEKSLEEVVRGYEAWKKQIQYQYEKRKEYLATDEGKEWNREHSRRYYEAHREQILQKRALKRSQAQELQSQQNATPAPDASHASE